MIQNPKILALGCAGAMGQKAVQTLVENSRFSRIQVADRDLNAAEKFVQTFPISNMEAINVDVTNREQLYTAMDDADIVISTVGPYYRFGSIVLKAAIETNTHYLDICDDWQPTEEMLNLDNEARAAGITAIIGAGASPGVSNLLAVKAAGELEQVEVLHTMWGTGARKSDNDDTVENSAALYHWLAMLTGEIRNYRGHDWVFNKPLERIPIDYPGIGRVNVYTLGHPEPISLPRCYPDLRESVNAMDLPRAAISILKRVSKKIDRNRMSLERGVDYVGKLFVANTEIPAGMAINEGLRQIWNTGIEVVSRKRYLPPLSAYAEGTANGKRTRIGVALQGEIPGGMPAVTGIPTAVMTDMLISGEITQRGAYAPETGVDPDIFFRKLSPFTTRPDMASQPVLITKA